MYQKSLPLVMYSNIFYLCSKINIPTPFPGDIVLNFLFEKNVYFPYIVISVPQKN